MRRIAVLDAPSNLGLRPPTATSVPGCAKAPGALRDHGLLARLGARDAGCLTPPRYDPGSWQPGDGVAQASAVAAYTKRLAARIAAIIDSDEFPVVLGGDCSILLGAGLAMRRYASKVDGYIGLVYVDGHSDFRHEGNSAYVGAAAGEALALATGRGQSDLAGIDRRRPYFRDLDVVLLGIRTRDEYRLDLQAAGIAYRSVPELRSAGAARSAQWARNQLHECLGYWVHVDVDVLDPAVMPAVDAPDPGGIAYAELELLLSGLVGAPECLGVQVTVFDPDYDVDGTYARDVTETLVAGLSPLLTASSTGSGSASSAGSVSSAGSASPVGSASSVGSVSSAGSASSVVPADGGAVVPAPRVDGEEPAAAAPLGPVVPAARTPTDGEDAPIATGRATRRKRRTSTSTSSSESA
jgi:arginase